MPTTNLKLLEMQQENTGMYVHEECIVHAVKALFGLERC